MVAFMASFTSTSLPFQGLDSSNGALHRSSVGSRPGCSHVFTLGDNASLHRGSQRPKHEIRGGYGRNHWQKTSVRSMVHENASTLLESSESADGGVALPNFDSSAILEEPANNHRLDSAVLEAASPDSSSSLGGSQRQVSLTSLMEPVAEDLQILNRNLQAVVGSENPLLMAAAEQIFSAGGKRMRPALVLLASRATAQLSGLLDLTAQHRQLAEIIEMIHTASLLHDDVLDESDMRRGKETIHQLYGTRVAVLAGDFLFAQSSFYLASLENLEVIKLISQVIKDFASGEIKQASSLFDCDITLQDYLDKSYYKTASLVAASVQSAAIFSGVSSEVCDKMFSYGVNLGLAFQILDDILDFTQSTEQLGKPAGSDLSKGNLTAPVLFALAKEPELRRLIDSEFTDEGTLEAAIKLVQEGGGIKKAHALAKQKGEEARRNLECLPQGPSRSSLEAFLAGPPYLQIQVLFIILPHRQSYNIL